MEKMCVDRREPYCQAEQNIYRQPGYGPGIFEMRECKMVYNNRLGVNISAQGFKLLQNAIYLLCMSIENISNKLQKYVSPRR